MLTAAILSLALALPQHLDGDESAPRGLTVVVVDVGQGDGALILAPDGTLHVVDGGPDGAGTAAMVPAIAALAPRAYGTVVLSHYHTDHHGGLDEVLVRYPFREVLDRGDVARPTNSWTSQYLAAAGARRKTAVPGQVVQLGGGAILTVIAADGKVAGGATVAVAGQSQEENARSVALRLDYGEFSMWLGGDLTGGGNGTPDVESPAALRCGDVDVYHVNHHGSNTSTGTNLVARLAPELAVVSAGVDNPYGHPTIGTINRLNQAAAARLLLATTVGTRAVGFAAAGDITIATDGERYRVAAENGEFLDFLVDERTRPPAAADLRITEVHRDPARVSDRYGEYVELTNVGGAPVTLKNVRVSTNAGTFTIFSNLTAYPGRPVLLVPDGDGGRNGGLPLGFVWPYRALELGDLADQVRLQHGSLTLDALSYAGGFAGGTGVAAERADALAATASGAFVAAPAAYGQGDRGSPARRNPGDRTAHPARLTVEVHADEVVLRAAALSHPGRLSAVALSFGNTGTTLFGTPIPIDFDVLFVVGLQLPDFVVPLPFEGYRSVSLPLRAPTALAGVRAHACHIVLEPVPLAVPAVSSATSFVFP